MIIGTVRPEESRVYNSHEGFHQFHAEHSQEPYGSFEIFFMSTDDIYRELDREEYSNVEWRELNKPGWYWVACFPGCLPDSEYPNGPFAYSQQAHEDADEWSPEYDD